MKKIYQNPEMKVVKLHSAAKLMAGSMMRYGGSTTATSGNLSRGDNYWDDEDDDY